MGAVIREYASIFAESEENERIDREIRRAKYAVKKGIPLEEVEQHGGRMVEQDDDPLGDFSIPVP